MKHVNYNLYQNTVILIETNFYKHKRAHFPFFLQKHDFSVIWGVRVDAQTRVLLLLELNSPCPPLHPTQWGFQLIPPSINRHMYLEKRGVYAWSECCVHLHLRIFPVELYVFEIGQLIAASVQVLSPHTGEYFVSHFMCSLLVRGNWKSR